ncbi:MAG: formylmethanofuran dehydrogenase subunit B [Thaumarchaeota archaeon]|jgi:formylmethanofuran dehydrogenase subunit B|nr:formylmethanofuran dehydrogenase subunit B [Nitrososphaerota archaeon]
MKVINAVLCPGCGSLCDDNDVYVEDNKIVKVRTDCAISSSKFLNYNKERNTTPLVRVNGQLKPTTLDDAIERVARMLVEAEYPLLYGWSLTSCEAQKKGVELAEEVGGVIDNTTTVCHGPSILGVQDFGEPTCSLGEVRARADLIIYWGCNPSSAHTRHMKRYSSLSKGRFRLPEQRKVVVVDVRRTPTARNANIFVQVKPNQDYELMAALKMMLQNEEIEEQEVAGVPVEQIEELAELMRSCEFGVLFFGLGLTMSEGKERNIDGALTLVRELNRWTKFAIMPMRGHYNVTGANKVFTWQTGYPYAVDFSRGYPRYEPGDTTAVDVLSRGYNDATLVVASDPVANLPKDAVRHLCSKPLAVIDPHISLTAYMADVVIPSAFIGIEEGGTAYRMDGVGLIMKKIVEPPEGILPDVQILDLILRRVRELKRGR